MKTRLPDWLFLVGGGIAFLLGLVLILWGSLSIGSVHTEGTVLKLEPSIEMLTLPDHTGFPQPVGEIVVYYPVVEYQVEGSKFLYRSRMDSSSYNIGQRVPVLFLKNRPSVSRIDSYSDRWAIPLLSGGMIVLLGLFSWALFATSIWFRRKFEAMQTTKEMQVAPNRELL